MKIASVPIQWQVVPLEDDIIMLNIRIATPPPGTDYPPGICSSYVFDLKPGDKSRFQVLTVSSSLKKRNEKCALLAAALEWRPCAHTSSIS